MYDIKWDMQPTERHDEVRSALRSIRKDLDQTLGKHLPWDNKVYATM